MALPIVNSARYTMTIPSTGQDVEFRPFLVKEEKVLMIAMESKDNKMMLKALLDILKACIYDDINVKSLTSFDVEELFLRLRSKSVGETVSIQLKCSECGGMTPQEINLDGIKMSKGPEDKTVMITDDVGLQLTYPSIELVGKMDYDPEKTSKDKQLKMTMDMITNCIDSIFDKENVWDAKNQTKEELKEFIEGLNSSQFAKITNFFGSIPALSHDASFTCIKCGSNEEVKLEGLHSFFT